MAKRTIGKAPDTLTPATFARGLKVLCAADVDLANVAECYGPPPFWKRPSGFGTLVLIILEQQVSLASARATFDRLQSALSVMTPLAFLELGDRQLKKIGFSRQKTLYCRTLAQTLVDRKLILGELAQLPDAEVLNRLTNLKGIGPWTAKIYLLMALRRPDIWPAGDLALIKAVRHLKKIPQGADPRKLKQISDGWKPWRAIAARLLWHYYLSRSPNKISP